MQNIKDVTQKISIIIPVYNTEKYLEECLDSVCNQTLKDIEIICINDGSPDNSEQILEKYAKQDKRIIVITQENKGISSARNTGIAYATGEYIYFLDSDDTIISTAMEKAYNTAEQYCLDMLFFDAEVVYESTKLKVKYKASEPYYQRKFNYGQPTTGINLFSKFIQNREFCVQACMYIIQRNFLQHNNLSFYEGILHEDELFTFQALLLSLQAMHISERLFCRKFREGSIMTTPRDIKNFLGVFICFKEQLFFIKKYDLDIAEILIHINNISNMICEEYYSFHNEQKVAIKKYIDFEDVYTQIIFKTLFRSSKLKDVCKQYYLTRLLWNTLRYIKNILRVFYAKYKR